MNEYVNDKSQNFTIYRYAYCVYGDYTVITGNTVQKDPPGQKTVAAVFVVLYFWKFLYYQHCLSCSASAYIRLLYTYSTDHTVQHGNRLLCKPDLFTGENQTGSPYQQESHAGETGIQNDWQYDMGKGFLQIETSAGDCVSYSSV